MADFIEDFLAGLENDAPKPRTFEDRITKMIMSSSDYQGSIMFAPFMNEHGKFYSSYEGVREFSMTTSLLQEGKTQVWVKVLPKNAYGELSAEDSNLYDEVAGLYDQVMDGYESLDPKIRYSMMRYRNYSIFQGVLLKHTNRDQQPITDNIGNPCLFIYPSLQPISAMSNAIKVKINSMGNKSWVTAIFAPTRENRQGAMIINFTKPDKPGYDCQVSFEFNSAFSQIIDPNNPLPEKAEQLCKNTVSDWIGWQNGENGLFNSTLFKELKATLTAELKKQSAGAPAPAAPVANQNGADPMLGAAPVAPVAPAPVQSPAPATTVAPGVEATKLPF